MPFKSKQQAKWMFVNEPEMAKEWAAETPSIKALPQRVKRRKRLQKRKKAFEFLMSLIKTT